jgi:hypothetical protein
MVAIKYTLTQEDFREIERARRGGIVKRIARVSFGSLAGFVGVCTIWQALFLFPWNHPSGNLLIACMGLICVWGGLEMPGLALVLMWLSDPYAPRELRIDDGSIVWLSGGKSRQFPWRPDRGFNENDKFFFLRALRDEAQLAIPKRAVTHDQELNLRELVRRVSVGTITRSASQLEV